MASQPSKVSRKDAERLKLTSSRRPKEEQALEDRRKRQTVFNQRYGWVVRYTGA